MEEAEGVDVGHALEHLIDEAVDLLLVDRVHHDQFAQGPADLETLPSIDRDRKIVQDIDRFWHWPTLACVRI